MLSVKHYTEDMLFSTYIRCSSNTLNSLVLNNEYVDFPNFRDKEAKVFI